MTPELQRLQEECALLKLTIVIDVAHALSEEDRQKLIQVMVPSIKAALAQHHKFGTAKYYVTPGDRCDVLWFTESMPSYAASTQSFTSQFLKHHGPWLGYLAAKKGMTWEEVEGALERNEIGTFIP